MLNVWGWWGCLNWKIRLGSAIVVLLLSAFLAIAEYSHDPWDSIHAPINHSAGQPDPPHDYRLAIFVGCVGMAMLMFSGRSDAEKLGYHD